MTVVTKKGVLNSSSSSSNNNAEKVVILPTIPDKKTISLFFNHLFNLLLTIIIIKASLGFCNTSNNTTNEDNSNNNDNNNNSVYAALAFYGVYHREPYNQLIHFIGVPCIIYSLFLYQCHLPIAPVIIGWTNNNNNSIFQLPYHYINWATIWLIIYTMFYSYIDLFGAAIYVPILFCMYTSAVKWVRYDQTVAILANKSNTETTTSNSSSGSTRKNNNWMGTSRVLYIAGIVQFLSWYIQVKVGHQLIEGAQPAVAQSIGGALTTAPLFAFYEFIWYIGMKQELHNAVLQQVMIYTKELCLSGIKMTACSTVT